MYRTAQASIEHPLLNSRERTQSRPGTFIRDPVWSRGEWEHCHTLGSCGQSHGLRSLVHEQDSIPRGRVYQISLRCCKRFRTFEGSENKTFTSDRQTILTVISRAQPSLLLALWNFIWKSSCNDPTLPRSTNGCFASAFH